MVTINKSIYVKETLYDCCAGKSTSTSYRRTRDLKMPHSAYNTQITHIKEKPHSLGQTLLAFFFTDLKTPQ